MDRMRSVNGGGVHMRRCAPDRTNGDAYARSVPIGPRSGRFVQGLESGEFFAATRITVMWTHTDDASIFRTACPRRRQKKTRPGGRGGSTERTAKRGSYLTVISVPKIRSSECGWKATLSEMP